MKIKNKCEQNPLRNGFTRSLNIAHAQLRVNCSNLNNDLYQLHVIDDPKCAHIDVRTVAISFFYVHYMFYKGLNC